MQVVVGGDCGHKELAGPVEFQEHWPQPSTTAAVCATLWSQVNGMPRSGASNGWVGSHRPHGFRMDSRSAVIKCKEWKCK